MVYTKLFVMGKLSLTKLGENDNYQTSIKKDHNNIFNSEEIIF